MINVIGIDLVKEEKHRKCIEDIVRLVSSSLRVKNVKIRKQETNVYEGYILRFCFDNDFNYEATLNEYNLDPFMKYCVCSTIIGEVKREFLLQKGLTFK